ncbi:hypothetical protein IT895_12575 [Halomonas sp. A40-4]|uniref:hypothetical protein n=1 Tax=Halomonas sp. A40-4 TaxID=2785909 RepID=UPI0018F0254B|nr:hypothetical protein [Halomonas sp. A40-4]QPL45028.1 hypothetical protein IT895_12575 [Halomonas sp. A40-4]
MNFNIGVQHPSTPHLYADLVELLAVYDYLGKGELHKNDVVSLANGLPVVADEFDETIDEDEVPFSDALKYEIRESKIEDLWTQMSYRCTSFSESYPFEIDGDRIIINTDWSSSKHRVYRFLLAASRLRSFHRSSRSKWAKVFANISALALESLLPTHADVKIFDANSEDRRDFYGTNCREALVRLGEQICVQDINRRGIDKLHSSGDAGIDLVGVVSFDDNASGSHVVFGQCGAQEREWPNKILEAHPISFRSYFTLLHDTVTTMFTPVTYRMANGDWVNDRHVSGALVLDRLRILTLLDKNDMFDEIVQKNYFVDFENEFMRYEVEM